MADEFEPIAEWERRAGEPIRWFTLFVKYYLSMGLTRSVRKAYLLFCEKEAADRFEDAKNRRGVPATWANMAVRWEWKKRAEAWEAEQTRLALVSVTEAAQTLRLLAMPAVNALALQLTSDRYAHLAAKEILDRAGLPATVRQEVQNKVTLTADDLAKAQKDVEAWENQTFGPKNKSEENG